MTAKTNDPLHASIVLTNGDTRVVSVHVYPDGLLKFSKIYGSVRVGEAATTEEEEESSK